MTTPTIVDYLIDPVTTYTLGAGSNRMVVAIMKSRTTSATTLTWGAQNFTKQSESIVYVNTFGGFPQSRRLSVWYMLEATLAALSADHNITVTGGDSAGILAWYVLTDADQVLPFNDIDYTGLTAADLASSLFITLPGAYVGDLILGAFADAVVPASGATMDGEAALLQTHNEGGMYAFVADQDADTYTLTAYQNGSTDFASAIAYGAVAVNGGGPPPPPAPPPIINMDVGKASKIVPALPMPSKAKKTRIQVIGTTGKSLRINPNATEGATLGENIWLPDGTIATVESLAELLGVGEGGGTATSTITENPFDPDAAFGTTEGSVLIRTDTEWTELTPGTDGQVLTTHGASAEPTWEDSSAFDPDAAFGSTRGSILIRDATEWTEMVPGTDGQILTTRGAGTEPTWEDVPEPSPVDPTIYNFALTYLMASGRFRH